MTGSCGSPTTVPAGGRPPLTWGEHRRHVAHPWRKDLRVGDSVADFFGEPGTGKLTWKVTWVLSDEMTLVSGKPAGVDGTLVPPHHTASPEDSSRVWISSMSASSCTASSGETTGMPTVALSSPGTVPVTKPARIRAKVGKMAHGLPG